MPHATVTSTGLSRRSAKDTASAATKPPAKPPACAQLLTLGMKNPNTNITSADIHNCCVTAARCMRRP